MANYGEFFMANFLWRIRANVFMANYGELWRMFSWRIMANVFMLNWTKLNCTIRHNSRKMYGEEILKPRGELWRIFNDELGPTQLRNLP